MDIKKARDLLTGFFADGKEMRFKAKETIVHVGETSKDTYWIESGVVKVFSYDESGSEQIHYLYKAQEIFSITALFGHTTKSVGFAAFTPVVIKVKPLRDTREFLAQHPYALFKLLNQQNTIYDVVINLNILSAEQRVSDRLERLCFRFGSKQDGHTIIKLPMTIQQFSEMVRLSRESTGRILRNLEDKGAIIMSRQRIVVYPDKLHDIIENPKSRAAVASDL